MRKLLQFHTASTDRLHTEKESHMAGDIFLSDRDVVTTRWACCQLQKFNNPPKTLSKMGECIWLLVYTASRCSGFKEISLDLHKAFFEVGSMLVCISKHRGTVPGPA